MAFIAIQSEAMERAVIVLLEVALQEAYKVHPHLDQHEEVPMGV